MSSFQRHRMVLRDVDMEIPVSLSILHNVHKLLSTSILSACIDAKQLVFHAEVHLLTALCCCCCAPLSVISVQRLRGLTGFSPVEVFRKYLWFMLRERKFDAAAVEDMTLLKTVLGLTDEQVGGEKVEGQVLSRSSGHHSIAPEMVGCPAACCRLCRHHAF